MSNLYSGFEKAKNGTTIPVFFNGKVMESRYNPQRDAKTLCDSIQTDSRFFLVTGIGSGIFINLLHNKYPEAKIIAFEMTNNDIDFLMQLETVQIVSKIQNIFFASLENLYDCMIQNYLPAKYGDIRIIEQRAWLSENQAAVSLINQTINKAVGIISADYSVQAHFGKLWLNNILTNSRLAEKINSKLLQNIPLEKTAVITGAGPSLDNFLSDINEEQRNNYFFISTDTAFSVLIKHNIEPEVCISIDGQSISYNHFLHKITDIKTIFGFDLCANASSAKKLYTSGRNLFIFNTGHPLSSAINIFGNNFLPELFSGSGTVTITAVDLAIKLGFRNIIIAGADFSYPDGKAYSKGTYLDSLYNKDSIKINNAELKFSSLLYRTPLIKITENRVTTTVLQAYKTSLEKYLESLNIKFSVKDGIYILERPDNLSKTLTATNQNTFSLKAFLNKLAASTPLETELLLLPYIAWLRNNEKFKNSSYEQLLQLAFNTIVSYNI